MEVAVTLTPLDISESSEPRRFFLNKEKRQVDVGRASRNPDRGAQPLNENAVFRCPIMSRLHARFTASPVEKALHIQDLGSTHGTFIGDRRVQKGSIMTVASGEVVTFGVRVTNGSLVYPAKAFRVEYKWQPRHDNDSPINSSRIFRVPDSDNEEEVVSIHSRESSVQVMESNIRATTYSVPSGSDYDSNSDDMEEDDEDLEISSSLGPHNNEDSTITTPEQHVICVFDEVMEVPKGEKAKNKTIDLNLKGPKLQEVIAKASGEGSSQNNPIDLDDQIVHDQEQLRRATDTQRPPVQESQNDLGEDGPVDLNETESEDDGPGALPIQPTTKQSNITNLLNDKPAEARKTSTESMVNSGAQVSNSANAEKSQIERIIRETQLRVAREEAVEEANGHTDCGLFQDPSTINQASSNVAESSNGATAGSEIEDEEDEEEMDEDFPVDFDEADDFDGPAHFDPIAEKPKNAPAPPNPSDAFISGDSIDVSAAPSLQESYLVQRAPSPSDAALARTSSNLGSVPRRNNYCPADFNCPTTHTKFSDPPTSTWHPTPAMDGFSLWRNTPLPSFPTRQYNSGPFSGNTVDTSSSCSETMVQAPNSTTRYQQYEHSNCFANYPPQSAEAPANEVPSSKTNEDPSSKLHISNLVNSYYAESSCSTKRKAAEISTDAEDLAFNASHSGLLGLSQGTPLPDAQACGTPMVTETFISLGETAEPTISSITTTVATETSPAEEPVRKKAKTSSSASGIGKFLIGVGVGAVGFAAAFLATIPAHVQEEARLGL